MAAAKDPRTGKFTSRTIPETQRWASWKDVTPEQWPWKYFSPEEIACRGTGKLVVHKSAMDKLEALRVMVGKPIMLNSAYRSPEHNKAVGGEENSYHMANRSYQTEPVMAFDVSMTNHEPYAFQEAAKACGFNGFGHYPKTADGKRNFMHIDNGPPRSWNLGGWFPRPSDKPVEVTKRFEPEPTKPSVAETLLKPEMIGPLGTAVGTTGIATAVANPANPIAWVFAIGLGLLIVGFFVKRFMESRKPNVTTPGTGD